MDHYGHMIQVLHRCICHAVTEKMMQMDLTSAQGWIMGYLARHETAPCAKDIEKKFRLSHPTVSGLLSRLEKKDFIEFRPDEQDRRCKRIYILPKGRAFNKQIEHAILDNERQIVDGFSEEEKTQFTDFLTRAAVNLGCGTGYHFDREENEE